MDMPGMMGAMGWWMLLWGAIGVAVLTIVVVVAVRMVRGGSGSDQLTASPAEEELRRRYAAGEFGHDEFLERQAILRRQDEQ